LLKATNKITAYAPQIEHQPCKPLNRPRQNAMPDTHLERFLKGRGFNRAVNAQQSASFSS
jgi:hypothetical protein